MTTARFIKGIIGTDEILYDGKFQVAFLGRSNVGKSTLINSLAQKQSLARSSSSPGKTIRMDFFLINDAFYFVDFPGYGYAKRSDEKREKIAKMILWYLLYSSVKKRLAVLIIDAVVGVTAFDRDMLKTFVDAQVPFVIVVNKIDKLKAHQAELQLQKIAQDAQTDTVIPFSSNQRIGRKTLMGVITSYLS